MASSSDEVLREYRTKRDFKRTAEPPGEGKKSRSNRKRGPAFVIQKHAASHLHFDLRLEVDGVMKSWAVPKGPSLDPAVRRLAIQVEDHPMEYNAFEGTIPEGEYGGGTVMLWDRGTYEADGAAPGEDEVRMRKELRSGKISITLHGERLEGSFALVRTRGESGKKPQWLLIKHDDETAEPGSEIVGDDDQSVASGRTMEEIASGKGKKRTWHSNRKSDSRPRAKAAKLGAVSPMLATGGSDMPEEDGWTFEPKFDGIRVLAFATEDSAALVTRNGNDKAAQFPELADALQALAQELGRPTILDGEIVALEDGEVVRFEALQGRMHVKSRGAIHAGAEGSPAALVVFDILADGDDVHIHEPWTARRERLEDLLKSLADKRIRLSESTEDGQALLKKAKRERWEGLIAKRKNSAYLPGRRSSDWLKVKLEASQEFVVGGYTEPRGSRKDLGALLLGYYDESGKLVYAGHTGGGFNRKSLSDMYSRLSRLQRKTSPFKPEPRTNEKAHWVTPRVVVEVRFNEWTRDGKLRQPIFLGVREDKNPKEVVREPVGPKPERRDEPPGAADLKIQITNPDKVFFPPPDSYRKGDLIDYYTRMAPVILPAMQDRPLVLKRYPNGIEGESFYQQSAPEDVPEGVRVETLQGDDGEKQRRFVGGNITTLLYTIQLGAISYDPWHSRIGALDFADYTIVDLDPGPAATFASVVQVARWIHDEMKAVELTGAIKTSGSKGLHIAIPLPARTPLEAATLVAQILATRVAERHPELATVERMRRNRPPEAVYVDYLQNILGKTVAGAYAVRAKPGASVSTPLRWDELTDELDMHDFNISTVPGRVEEIGDLWGNAIRSKNSLEHLLGG